MNLIDYIINHCHKEHFPTTDLSTYGDINAVDNANRTALMIVAQYSMWDYFNENQLAYLFEQSNLLIKDKTGKDVLSLFLQTKYSFKKGKIDYLEYLINNSSFNSSMNKQNHLMLAIENMYNSPKKISDKNWQLLIDKSDLHYTFGDNKSASMILIKELQEAGKIMQPFLVSQIVNSHFENKEALHNLCAFVCEFGALYFKTVWEYLDSQNKETLLNYIQKYNWNIKYKIGAKIILNDPHVISFFEKLKLDKSILDKEKDNKIIHKI